MKTEQILQLVEAVSGFGLDEFEYEEDGVKLKLKKGGNVCTSVSAETAGRTKTEAEIARTEENAEVLLEGKIVKAPLVGIFYASPEEGGTPFVQAGDKVEKGTVLGIVEAMKLMNDIESDLGNDRRGSCRKRSGGRIRTASFCHQIKNDTKTA